jgi:DNA gyrase/topoisomerase IV subunit B
VSAGETRLGGTHRRGLTTGLSTATLGLVPGVGADVLAHATDGLVAVVHVSLDHPKFGGPTRERLDSPIGETVTHAATLAAFTHLPVDLRTRVAAMLARRLGIGDGGA